MRHPPNWLGFWKPPLITISWVDPTLISFTLSMLKPRLSETPAPSICRLFCPATAVTLTLKILIL